MSADLVIAGIYFAVMLRLGWRARRGSADAYWVAERRYPAGPVAASLVATIFGASSTVGLIGLGYERGLTGAWWALVGGLALLPFGLLLAGRVRALEVYTLPDVLERAYGKGVGVAGASVIAVAWAGVVAAQMVAGAVLLTGLAPLSLEVSVLLVGATFILYTLWGGQISVVRTDSWQLLLFGGSLLVALALVLGSVLGGAGGGLSALPPGHWAFPVSEGFGWYDVLVYYPLIVGMPYLVGPDIYTRVLCARQESDARRASLLAALMVIPLSFLLAGLGLLLRARFPGLAPEAAFPIAVRELAPPGLRGLIVIGILGAVMSSADTTLLSAATILSRNVIGTVTGISTRAELRLTRVFVVVVGLVAGGIAVFQQGIIASLLVAYTVFVGGLALPTLATFATWRWRVGARGAAWAVAAGGSAAVAGQVRDGVVLRLLLGRTGTSLAESALGPQWESLLPLLISGVVLLLSARPVDGGARPVDLSARS